MSECLFCRIAHKQVDAVVVHEDEHILAFLDIGPIRDGHTQIIPKQHYETFEVMPRNLAVRILDLGQQLGRRMKTVFGVDRVAFVFTGGDVPHVHAHVVPLHEKTDITSARYIVEPKHVKWDSSHLRVQRSALERVRERLGFVAASAALGLALAGAAPVAAQEVSRSGATNSRLARAVAALGPGTHLRVAAAGQRSEGQFRGAARDSLLLGWQEVTWAVPLERVDTLWVRQRATGTGAVAGAVVGAVALTALGLTFPCEKADGCSEDYPAVIVLGGLVGAGGGALVGGVLGSLGRRWSRRYP